MWTLSVQNQLKYRTVTIIRRWSLLIRIRIRNNVRLLSSYLDWWTGFCSLCWSV